MTVLCRNCANRRVHGTYGDRMLAFGFTGCAKAAEMIVLAPGEPDFQVCQVFSLDYPRQCGFFESNEAPKPESDGQDGLF